MKRRFYFPLLPFTPRRYCDPAPPAPSPVADPAPAGGDDPGGDLMSIDLPDLSSDLGDILDGTAPPDPSAPPTPKPTKSEPPAPKPGDPKPGEPKPPTPPAPKPPADPPAKQLREELEATKRERDELKATVEKGDPRLKAADEAVKAKEREIAEVKKQNQDYERRLALANPEVVKKLSELDQSFDADAAKYARSAALSQPQVNSLVGEYAKLPFGKEGYKEARADFEKRVNETLGGSEDSEHRKLGSTLDFIERTYDFIRERQVVEKDVSTNALKLQREWESTKWNSESSWVRTTIDKAKTVPPELKERDPFHPKVMLGVFEAMIPEEKRAAYTQGLPEYIELVMAGLKPDGDDAYPGRTPEQVSEARAADQERYQQAREYSIDVQYNGLRALRMFPALVREVQRLREKLKEDTDGNPPDPTKPNGDAPGGGGDDIKDFQAPNLDNLQV